MINVLTLKSKRILASPAPKHPGFPQTLTVILDVVVGS